MKIKHGILGPKRNTHSTYGQEIDKSRNVLEGILKEKNEQEMRYVLSVAELKSKGEDLSIVKLKELFDKAMLKGDVVLAKMRFVNFYLNSFMPKEAKRFIEKFKGQCIKGEI
jgi:hypothetical protein